MELSVVPVPSSNRVYCTNPGSVPVKQTDILDKTSEAVRAVFHTLKLSNEWLLFLTDGANLGSCPKSITEEALLRIELVIPVVLEATNTPL